MSQDITFAVTKHGNGVAVRTVKTVRTTMLNALNLYDPFIMPEYKGLADLAPWVDSRLGAAKAPRPQHHYY